MLRKTFLLALAALLLAGCESVYYETMEAFGMPKRDLLVDRVEEARDTQEEAKEQFQDALQKFMALVRVDGGKLEAAYETLKTELEESEEKASAVSKRVDAVASVGEALFAEWNKELDQYTSDRLRAQSAQKMRETRQEFDSLLKAMRQAESRIEPVLSVLRDQVLYLKHNLNARAIASLRDELRIVENDVDTLIRDMEFAIQEANRFLAEYDTGTPATGNN